MILQTNIVVQLDYTMLIKAMQSINFLLKKSLRPLSCRLKPNQGFYKVLQSVTKVFFVEHIFTLIQYLHTLISFEIKRYIQSYFVPKQ